ncbi:hypothetical protein BO70DRAFT_389302 [Aspergillus heteromorphus CBS 117.55]|uniref:Rhodopsin domain-containing protein n=1 Tax=Aspergillus heteromorphus CBS 117.55 TaxID=1448321 RepID=A0A317VJI4_9EURO|nr:uncharacterized protein BO70DRAFT_389302 [Aspergillus heteromorphus CBS 117.55]PWY73012.1 hypothetical protein BO70DRAFT_389302 [Aspergillus heteromorphus CBS 117.55]
MASSMPLTGHSLGIFICAAVLMGVCTVLVILRSFVRIFLVRAFGWDDALMIVALVLLIAMNTCWMIGAEHGVGHRNVEFTDLKTMEQARLLWWLSQIFYMWSSAFAKISIAIALLRLAVNKIQRIILWTVIGLVIAIGLMIWLTFVLDCQPVSYFWMAVDTNVHGNCGDPDTLLTIAYVYSSLTIISDGTLGIMPGILLWQLKMNQRTKAALAAVLSLGAIASVAVIIRLPFLHTYKDPDFLYSTFQIIIWSMLETGIGIAAGSLATLRALFRWVLEEASGYGRSSSRGKRTEGQHPLASLTTDRPKKGSQHISYWRPDLSKTNGLMVTTVSSPMAPSHMSFPNSSQENLNPNTEPWGPHHVNVHRTFEVSDGSGGMI